MASWSRYAGAAWVATLSLAACGARTAPGEWPLEASSGGAATGGHAVLGGSPSVSSGGRGGAKASAGSFFGGSGGASHGGSGGSLPVSAGEAAVAGSAGEESAAGAGGAAPLLATFEPLGQNSGASAISADGRVVVGGLGDQKPQGFRYSEQTKMVGLGFLSEFQFADSVAAATNRDGSLVVGSATVEVPGGLRERAYRVRVPGSLQPLASLPGWDSSYAAGVSADGALVVGFAVTASVARQAFRWTESAGVEALGDFSVNGVSADGKVIVGSRNSDSSAQLQTAVRWTNDGLVDLGVAGLYTEAVASNADGSVVVGQRWDAEPLQGTPRIPFRWTEKLGARDLPPLPGNANCSAIAVSADGSVAVGECNDKPGAGDVQHATIWDAHGARALADVLQAAGADLQGFAVTYATGVSANGKAVCGWGTDPNGKREAWLARLP